jgi:C4-dicarboxylate-specific signal transduction histidine kinase
VEKGLLHFHFPQMFATFAFTAIARHSRSRASSDSAELFLDAQMTTVSRALYDLVFIIFALLMTRVTRTRDELEVKVAERTTELMRANEGLKAEIAERRHR